jgi:hypothetical protein
MQSIFSKEITIKLYDLLFIHAMMYLIYKIVELLGGLEGVLGTFLTLKVF